MEITKYYTSLLENFTKLLLNQLNTRVYQNKLSWQWAVGSVHRAAEPSALSEIYRKLQPTLSLPTTYLNNIKNFKVTTFQVLAFVKVTLEDIF